MKDGENLERISHSQEEDGGLGFEGPWSCSKDEVGSRLRKAVIHAVGHFGSHAVGHVVRRVEGGSFLSLSGSDLGWFFPDVSCYSPYRSIPAGTMNLSICLGA